MELSEKYQEVSYLIDDVRDSIARSKEMGLHVATLWLIPEHYTRSEIALTKEWLKEQGYELFNRRGVPIPFVRWDD